MPVALARTQGRRISKAEKEAVPAKPAAGTATSTGTRTEDGTRGWGTGTGDVDDPVGRPEKESPGKREEGEEGKRTRRPGRYKTAG